MFRVSNFHAKMAPHVCLETSYPDFYMYSGYYMYSIQLYMYNCFTMPNALLAF